LIVPPDFCVEALLLLLLAAPLALELGDDLLDDPHALSVSAAAVATATPNHALRIRTQFLTIGGICMPI